jgi:hypothetical protein
MGGAAMVVIGQAGLMTVAVLGVVLVAVAAMVWVGTQTRAAVIAMVVGVAIAVAAVGTDYLWVTPAEEVEATLHALADTLEQNDPERVAEFLADSNESLRSEVRGRLQSVRVESISIKSNLRVNVGVGRPPKSAETQFNAVAVVRDRRGTGESYTVPRFFVVQWVREDGGWRVASYTMQEPMGGRRPAFP